MQESRTRKVVIAGVLGAIAAFLGWTHWGFIPWFSGASLTIMHVPVIIGAVLEGPVVGAAVGLIFGLFSMLQAAIAPSGPTDVWFTNPVLAVLPRLFIGPVAWLVWRALQRWPAAGLIGAGFAVALSYAVSKYVMNITWEFNWVSTLVGVLVTAFLVTAVGVLASFDVLFRKPLATLRSQ